MITKNAGMTKLLRDLLYDLKTFAMNNWGVEVLGIRIGNNGDVFLDLDKRIYFKEQAELEKELISIWKF